jgi:hypothetical protein
MSISSQIAAYSTQFPTKNILSILCYFMWVLQVYSEIIFWMKIFLKIKNFIRNTLNSYFNLEKTDISIIFSSTKNTQ